MTSIQSKKDSRSKATMHDPEMERKLQMVHDNFGILKGKSKYKTFEEQEKALRKIREEVFEERLRELNMS